MCSYESMRGRLYKGGSCQERFGRVSLAGKVSKGHQICDSPALVHTRFCISDTELSPIPIASFGNITLRYTWVMFVCLSAEARSGMRDHVFISFGGKNKFTLRT